MTDINHDLEHDTEEVCESCSGLTEHAHEKSCCGNESGHDHGDGSLNWTNTIFSFVAITAGIVMEYMGVGGYIPRILLMVAILVEGYKPAISGVKALKKGVIGIDLLMTVAATGAVLIGEYTEGALVLFLKDLSMKLEVIAGNRARHAIEALMELRPEVARIKRNGDEIEVPVDQVMPGELFVVRPGDRIPLDGSVVDGHTTVDQSMMTGESVPIHKGYLDEVFAGTINLDGVLSVKTTRASAESMLSNILRMVHEAEERRSPTENIVNRFARYYTPVIMLLASILALTPPLLFNAPLVSSVYNGLVLLVIGCPCAFTIATPVAMVSALTSASRNGVLIKGSTFIEEMNKAKVFAFDKTGTLTQGKLKVTDVIP
ncbi:cation-translocating P-type ATPase, partial [Candidatus Bathyarchaeota archaeon]|nr:cation-translocating P-type ATPase [Candidatus Bathyarchaeota archaeon]